MIEKHSSLAEALNRALGAGVRSIETAADGVVTVEVAPEQWLEAARTLRDDEAFAFEQLIDLCGVDYLGFGTDEWETADVTSEGFSRGVEGNAGPGRFDWEDRPTVEMEERFGVSVIVLSLKYNRRLRLKTRAADSELPVVPSLIEIWAAANWFELEAFDLLGIVFEGHPDLRRILTDYGFVGHPFRKDFPLIGNVEMRYDEEKGRVVYQPVSIEPRVGVPKVVRSDSRYAGEDKGHG